MRGEKTSEKALYDAIRDQSLTWGGDKLVDYTCFASVWEKDLDGGIPTYSVYVELENELQLTEDDRVALDRALCAANPIYESYREKDSISMLLLHVVKVRYSDLQRQRQESDMQFHNFLCREEHLPN